MILGRAFGRSFLIALVSGAIGYSLHAQRFTDGNRTDAGGVFAWQVFLLAGLATFILCYARPRWWWAGLVVGVTATFIGLNGTPLPFEGAARAIFFDYEGPIVPDGGGGDGGNGRVLVAAGDSYSSGEGNPPFDQGTGSGCRRSSRSWNRNLDAASSRSLDVVHIACSGAVMKEVTSRGTGGEPPQVQQIRQTAAFSHIGAVTLTIGGNDGGFSLLAAACFAPWPTSCESSTRVAQETRRTVTRDWFVADLAETYRKVREAADGAPLFVMNYPIAFDTDATPRRRCSAGSGFEAAFRATQREQETVIAFQLALNEAVATAVDRAGDDVHLIDVADAFQDHPLCGDRSFYVPLDFGTEDRFFVPQKAFHPNERGQERLRERADSVIESVL